MKRTDFGLRVFFGTGLSAAAALRAITGSAFAAYPRMAFQNNKTRKTVQSFFHFIISGFLIAGMYGHGSSMRKSIIGGVDMKEPIAASSGIVPSLSTNTRAHGWDEPTIYRTAYAFEQSGNWTTM